jgi:hypothetical protein
MFPAAPTRLSGTMKRRLLSWLAIPTIAISGGRAAPAALRPGTRTCQEYG